MTPSAGLSIDIATWMLEHLTPRPYNEVLAGDLLEEFHTGHSVLWYWRQVIIAIALCAAGRISHYAFAAIFSAAWSLLYPAWQISLWNNQAARSLFDHGAALNWPLSGISDLSRGVLPVISFICFGLFFFYLLLQPRSLSRPSLLGVLGGLSLSLNIFLITLISLRHWAAPWGDRLHTATPGAVYAALFRAPLHYGVYFISLALGLLSAILAALPSSRHHQRLARS